MSMPTLVQSVTVNGVTEPAKFTSITVPLPNATLASNCIIASAFYDHGVTCAVTDDKSNSYGSAACNIDDSTHGQQLGTWVCAGATAGARYLTFSFSGSGTEYFMCHVEEWYNVATSNAVDATGTYNPGGTPTAITTSANVSPSTANDLFYLIGASDSTGWPNAGITYTLKTQSNITWSFGATNSSDGLVAVNGQYSVTTGFKPEVDASAGANWLSNCVALKSASAGTAPSAGIRIVSACHYDFGASTSNTPLQWVTQGNLQIALQTSAGTISAISSTRGSWNTRESSSSPATPNQYAKLQDSVNQSAGTQNLTVAYGAGGGSDLILLDVTGAATSPWDNGQALNNQNSSASPLTGPSVTPSTSNGLVVCCAAISLYTCEKASGSTSAINAYGLPDESDVPMDQNNGFSICYSPNTSPVNFGWNTTGGVGAWNSVAGAYEAGATTWSVSAGLAASTALADSGVATMVGSETLAAKSALAHSGVATMVGSETLAANSALAHSGVATMVGSETLAANSALAHSGVATFAGLIASQIIAALAAGMADIPPIPGFTGPALVQHRDICQFGLGGSAITQILIPMPNKMLANNCLLVAVANATVHPPSSITDDAPGGSSTYALVDSAPDSGNGYNVSLWIAQGVKAGARKIWINFTGSNFPSGTDHVSAKATEFAGVALSAAVDAHNHYIANSTTIAAGSISPGEAGDLLYQAGFQDSADTGSAATAFTAGSQPGIAWALVPGSANTLDGSYAQWGVYGSTGPLNPTLTVDSAQNYVSVCAALKSADVGTLPPATGLRVVSVQSIYPYVNSSKSFQFVSSGNLQLLLSTSTDGLTSGGVASTVGTWTRRANAQDSGEAITAYSEIWDCPNVGPGSQTITLTFNAGNDDHSVQLWDVIGAAAAPFDNAVAISNPAPQTTGSALNYTQSITPSQAGELVVTAATIDVGQLYDLSSGQGTTLSSTPVNDQCHCDENNGYGGYLAPNASAITFSWTEEEPVNYWSAAMACYNPFPATTWSAAAALAAASALATQGGATMVGAASLPAGASLSDSGAANLSGLVALLEAAGLSASIPAVLLGSITFQMAAGLAGSGSGTMSASSAIASQAALTPNALASFVGSLVLSALEGFSPSGAGQAWALSMSLAAQGALAAAGIATMGGAISLVEIEILGAQGQAAMASLVSLAESSGLGASAIATLAGAITLAAIGSFLSTIPAGTIYSSQVLLAAKAALGDSAIASFLASCGLSAEEIFAAAGQGTMSVSTQIGAQLGTQASALQTVQVIRGLVTAILSGRWPGAKISRG